MQHGMRECLCRAPIKTRSVVDPKSCRLTLPRLIFFTFFFPRIFQPTNERHMTKTTTPKNSLTSSPLPRTETGYADLGKFAAASSSICPRSKYKLPNSSSAFIGVVLRVEVCALSNVCNTHSLALDCMHSYWLTLAESSRAELVRVREFLAIRNNQLLTNGSSIRLNHSFVHTPTTHSLTHSAPL